MRLGHTTKGVGVKMQNVKVQVKIRKFRRLVRNFYKKNRRDMPWRRTRNAYHILVSEVMLQQTRVSRVMEKYPAFLKRFPTVQSLAHAPLSAVLKEWSGLGYNRRAKFLKQAAEKIVRSHQGRVPATLKELARLPGVGKSTAGGVLAFAYNTPTVFIETNIRRVFLHHFFPNQKNIPDSRIFPLVEKSLDRANSREWYYALFDYGAHLAETMPNPNVRSLHYARQTKFKGSFREARGKILRTLISNPRTFAYLVHLHELDKTVCGQALRALIREGFVRRRGKSYIIAR